MSEFPLSIYHKEIPSFLLPFLDSKEMRRIKNVGMNCGVEYSSLPFFSSLPKSSRYDHSLGVALIAYHFSKDEKMSLAGLFHDIATPCFAHTIDFLLGDHSEQTATEEKTMDILSSSISINDELEKLGIPLKEVSDYSQYPLCDNKAPKLSADRLEYTLRNILLFGFGKKEDIEQIYQNLTFGENENKEKELVFRSLDKAKLFGSLAMKTFEVYVSKEDRYAMELLSSTLKSALQKRIIDMDDLYQDETHLIGKLNSSEVGKEIFEVYSKLCGVKEGKTGIKVATKIRYIDPYIEGKGRLSKLDSGFETRLNSLLQTDFSVYLIGSCR